MSTLINQRKIPLVKMENSVLIITHNAKILESLNVDKVHVLKDGRIVEEGDAALIDKIETGGFSHLDGDQYGR